MEEDHRRCERGLRETFGFLAARVALDERGEVAGVYVVDRGGDDPAAVITAVRDFLREHCDREVAPSTVSLTQLGEEERGRLRLDLVAVRRDRGGSSVKVAMSFHGLVARGSGTGEDLAQAGAAAALEGLNRCLGSDLFALRDVGLATVGGHGVVLAALAAVQDGALLIGASWRQEDLAEAAARAVLAAVNRRLATYVLP
ncbi:MAG: hypothetical protein M0Z27_00870 [Thermaerobacter sp.]|nr:hypothetical protein [Thermaerobacter sp.]